MQAVILAAGVGTRLGRPFPKSLSILPNGEKILGRQIRLLREAGIRSVTVVVGFKMSLIMEDFPDVYYSYNPVFYVTNTSKSLAWGLRHMDDDVLWLNGDVVFEPGVLEKTLAAPKLNLVCVDKKRCGEEEVKYRQDSAGLICEISKGVKNGEGEALGINLVRR
jgi:choline kinase